MDLSIFSKMVKHDPLDNKKNIFYGFRWLGGLSVNLNHLIA